jgi:hypothetical protein
VSCSRSIAGYRTLLNQRFERYPFGFGQACSKLSADAAAPESQTSLSELKTDFAVSTSLLAIA